MKPSPNFYNGFTSLDTEFNNVLLSNCRGTIPDSLFGQLIRVGPAKFQIGTQKVNHWFDGLSMLYKFEFKHNQVFFSNSFLKSPQYLANLEGKMICDEFGTKAKINFLKRIFNVASVMIGAKQNLTANCNVNTTKIANNFIAMTETTTQIKFNPDSLNSGGFFKYDDNLEGDITTAHPMFDQITKEQFNFCVKISPLKNQYIIYKTLANSSTRHIIAQFSKPYFFYSHSFFLTQNHIILYNGPIQTTASKLLKYTFNEALTFNNNHQSEFIIINRNSGEIRTIDTDSFIFLHSVNAYEDNNLIHLNMVTYNTKDNPYNSFYLDKLQNGDPFPVTELRHYEINLLTTQVSFHKILDDIIEFPCINYQYNMSKYQYLYANYIHGANDFLNGIIKIDVKCTNNNLKWHEDGCYPSEVVFVKQKNTSGEDDAFLITNVYDSNRHISFLLILEAKNLVELFRADLPCHIPFPLHGHFYS